VPVVVASAAIPYGAKLEAAKLTVAQLPVGAAPQGAYASISQVIGQAGGAPIALIPIAAREPILPAKLSGGGGKPTVAAMIADGMRAYTIGVTDVAGGGGHVMPGDRVDVVLTRDLSTMAGGEQGGGKRLVSNVVIQNVRVLGMDLNADPNSTQATVAHTATLEVSVEDAEKLALSAQAGTLTLALRRTGAAEIAAVRTIAANDLGANVGAGGFAPKAGPGGAIMAARHRTIVKPEVRRHSVIVVHGDKESSVEVPRERGSGV
jgi:pilus assembly protein CpaB